MLKFNNYTLKKLETLFLEAGIKVRYGKGNFSAGYCILESRNVVVVNRYYATEARINSLLDLLFKLKIDQTLLSPISQKFYHELSHQQQELDLE